MPKNNDSDDLLGLTEKIVSSHVSNNSMASADLPNFIRAVYAALGNVSTGAGTPSLPKPVVPIKRSVTPNHVVCLEDGKKFKMLRRHLKTDHNMSPDEYRVKWGLRPDYPMTAPAYAQQRSAIAKRIGLGRKPGKVKTKAKGKSAAKR